MGASRPCSRKPCQGTSSRDLGPGAGPGLAQPRQVRLAQVAKARWVEVLDEALAKGAGERRGRARVADVVDATVTRRSGAVRRVPPDQRRYRISAPHRANGGPARARGVLSRMCASANPLSIPGRPKRERD